VCGGGYFEDMTSFVIEFALIKFKMRITIKIEDLDHAMNDD
jgi:hypothetical protein